MKSRWAAHALATVAALAVLGTATPGGGTPVRPERPAPRTVEVQILGLKETNGQLVPTRRDGRLAGGAGVLGSYLAAAEAENRRTLILDSGDFMQGPPISSYFQGASTVDVFNAMGVDAVAVGNHEFDWGIFTLAERIRQADFPFLAANIVREGTGAPPARIAPYAVFNLHGVKVGVIGLGNPDTKNVTLPAATEGLAFLDPAASTAAANAAVQQLRRRRVETIVVLAHMGLETSTSGPLVEIVEGLSDQVDLVLGGNDPREFNTVVGGIPVVQPYGNTAGYADVALTVDRVTRDVVAVRAETRATWVEGVTPDRAVQAIVDRYQRKLRAALSGVVGEARTPIVRNLTAESEMGDLVTDAIRAYLPGVDFAFINAGAFRADIDAGPITLEEIYAVQPFNNRLIVMDLTGAQVIQVLEEGAASRYGTVQVSGLRWSFDDDAPIGERVRSVSLPDGTPIDPAATYRVATNDFMAAGGDQFATLTRGMNPVDTGKDPVDAIVAWLAAHSPVDPQIDGRLTIL